MGPKGRKRKSTSGSNETTTRRTRSKKNPEVNNLDQYFKTNQQTKISRLPSITNFSNEQENPHKKRRRIIVSDSGSDDTDIDDSHEAIGLYSSSPIIESKKRKINKSNEQNDHILKPLHSLKIPSKKSKQGNSIFSDQLNNRISKLRSSSEIPMPINLTSSTCTKMSNLSINKDKSINKEIQPPQNYDNTPWIEKYKPLKSSDIAIHPKKLKEVSEAIKSMINCTSSIRILVLSGPAGSSKSTCIKLLAEELIPTPSLKKSKYSLDINDNDNDNDSKIIEWDNPTTIEGSTKMSTFEEFLKSCLYFKSKNLKIILIEDFPNIFHQETKIKFQNALINFIYTNLSSSPPLILSITEVDSPVEESWSSGSNNKILSSSYSLNNSFTTEMILGKELLNDKKVKRIKFNPIAKTIISKSLESIIKFENLIFNKISKNLINEELNKIIKLGDIRSSICSLEFWSKWQIKLKKKKKSINQNNDEYLTFGRENRVGFFNSIGKVIYGSKNDEISTLRRENTYHSKFKLNSNNNENENYKIEQNAITVQDVLNNWSGKSTSLLTLSIHENYTILKNKLSLDIASKCAETISMGDIMQCSDSTHDIGLDYTIRGTRYYLDQAIETSNKSQGFRGLNFPRIWKVTKKRRQIVEEVSQYNIKRMKAHDINARCFDDIIQLDGYYEPIINMGISRKLRNETIINDNKKKVLMELKERLLSKRIGGPVSGYLFADSEIFAGDDEQSSESPIDKDIESSVNMTDHEDEDEDEDLTINETTLEEDLVSSELDDDEEFGLDEVDNWDLGSL